ncbi:MAG: hypothetical protein GY832_33755 [Chloroflexi bacterium]|nr:hypothetical protein [Chloroflexota bacterium]
MFPGYATLIPYVVALLAYFAGLVVAIFLLVRSKGTAAILAVVGFALLVLIATGQIVLFLPLVIPGLSFPSWVIWVFNCCCSILNLGAIASLIVSIWQAVSGMPVGDDAQETEYTDDPLEEGVILDVFEEAPGDIASATIKLDDTLDGEILEDTQADSSYKTQVLSETQEGAAEESE